MSALVFVQHLDQLAGLIGGNATVTILEIQDRRFPRSRIHDMRAFPARPDEADRFGRLARIRETNVLGVVAYRGQKFFAPRHQGIILHMVSVPHLSCHIASPPAFND